MEVRLGSERRDVLTRRLLAGNAKSSFRRIQRVPRSFWRRRIIIVAALTVALSVGIVFASIPYLPHTTPPHSSITTPITQKVRGGTQTYPGYAELNLPTLSDNETFAVRVAVTNGTATFCAILASTFQAWAFSGNPSASTFPSSYCSIYEQTAQATLTFLPSSAGSWDIASLNYSPTQITVVYSPA